MLLPPRVSRRFLPSRVSRRFPEGAVARLPTPPARTHTSRDSAVGRQTVPSPRSAVPLRARARLAKPRLADEGSVPALNARSMRECLSSMLKARLGDEGSVPAVNARSMRGQCASACPQCPVLNAQCARLRCVSSMCASMCALLEVRSMRGSGPSHIRASRQGAARIASTRLAMYVSLSRLHFARPPFTRAICALRRCQHLGGARDFSSG